MTSVRLLQTCCISTSLNALFSRDSPLNIHKALVVATKRTTVRVTRAAPRRPHRRAWSAHATPFRRRRAFGFANHSDLLFPPPPHSSASPSLALRRMEAARRDKLHMEATVPLKNSIDDAMLLPGTPSPVSRPRQGAGHDRHASAASRYVDDSVPPSPSPSRQGAFTDARPSRSGSTASRSTKRLSLTLPIAQPSAGPSRPTPVSTTTASFPPTPLDTPSILSPADPNDFITAIAAQERRVLELGEDLRTAKLELDRLKKQFIHYESSRERQRERQSRRNMHAEPLRPIATTLDDTTTATTRSIELDRRKALLLNQTQNQSTPENSRRRVFSGAHTRTLSLLSPTKSDSSAGFPVLHEDNNDGDGIPDAFRQGFADYDTRPRGHLGHIAKRASWAPRSTTMPPPPAPGGVKQIAQDLKQGIWTFVDDLRQATIGDEPITGHRGQRDGDETIRASSSGRAHVGSLFSDEPEPVAGGRRGLTRSNTDVGKTKRFSWTPLTVESYDDNDWSNWDSPSASANTTPARWSGTTVNGDIIPSIPEKRDDLDTPLKSKIPRSPLGGGHSPSMSGGKLEELLPPVLNQIPGKISGFMKGWERSLAAPEGPERAPSPGRLV